MKNIINLQEIQRFNKFSSHMLKSLLLVRMVVNVASIIDHETIGDRIVEI